MKNTIELITTVLLAILLTACGQADRSADAKYDSKPFSKMVAAQSTGLSDYWYQGKAEISSYRLSQYRYADTHPGEAVLIFVTEDFLPEKQVKDEYPAAPNSVKVLKNNHLRKFPTGIYDYSIMASVFTPVHSREYPHTLKVSMSSQEWCGQAYMQINKRDDRYQMELHSYFEREADQRLKTPLAILEDELFNRIRINPEGLPTGELQVLPSTIYCRLNHKPFEVHSATASLSDYQGSDFEGKRLRAYRLEYPDLQRTLEIIFETEAPYLIAGWSESYPAGPGGKRQTTIAVRKATLLNPYWQHNGLQDSVLRAQLDLSGI